MPSLGKDDAHITTLSDSNTNGESPCDLITTQDESDTDIQSGGGGGTIEDWWNKAKESGWLPWVVAAGFGVLWLRKDKKKKQ